MLGIILWKPACTSRPEKQISDDLLPKVTDVEVGDPGNDFDWTHRLFGGQAACR